MISRPSSGSSAVARCRSRNSQDASPTAMTPTSGSQNKNIQLAAGGSHLATISVNVLVPAAAALAGALIGSLAPIVVGLIQSRAEHKRERMRLVTQLAIEDHKAAIELVKLNRRGAIPPLSTYVAYHADVLALVAAGKSITPQ